MARLRRYLAIPVLLAVIGLAGCAYAPYPGYAYGYPSYAYVGPPVAVGGSVFIGGWWGHPHWGGWGGWHGGWR